MKLYSGAGFRQLPLFQHRNDIGLPKARPSRQQPSRSRSGFSPVRYIDIDLASWLGSLGRLG